MSDWVVLVELPMVRQSERNALEKNEKISFRNSSRSRFDHHVVPFSFSTPAGDYDIPTDGKMPNTNKVYFTYGKIFESFCLKVAKNEQMRSSARRPERTKHGHTSKVDP
jgi:hypothetical protein